MMEPKVWFFDRFGQAFDSLKQNFKQLVLPLFIFKTISFIVFSIILASIFGDLFNLEQIQQDPQQAIKELYTNVDLMIAFVVYLTIGLIFLLAIVPFYIATWKAVVNQFAEKENIFSENIAYGFKNFMNVLKVYWFTFVYVALYPALLFIVWGVMLNLALLDYIDMPFAKLGGFIMWISWIWFLVSVLYRGMKASFVLLNSVDRNDFTHENFLSAVEVTDDNWWRILGNYLLLGLIVWLLSWFVTGIIWVIQWIAFVSSVDIGDIMNNAQWGIENIDPESIASSVQGNTLSTILGYIKDIVTQIVWVIAAVFGTIFTLLFLKRLQIEKNTSSSEWSNTL